MVAKRRTTSTKKVKSLKSKSLTSKQEKGVKGGRKAGGNVAAKWSLSQGSHT